MQPDHSLWKIVFGFMIMVAGLVFMGALAMSDADIFNVEMARAEAERLSSQTAYEAQKGEIDLSFYPQLALERSLAQIRLIRAQAEWDATAIAEGIRMRQAENDRMLADRARFDLVKALLFAVGGFGVLVVAFYALLLVTHRTVERLLPRQRADTSPAAPPAAHAIPLPPAGLTPPLDRRRKIDRILDISKL